MPDAFLLQSLPDAAILTDLAGVVRGWNDAAARLFGWTAAEMIGRPLVERFPEPVRAEIGRHIEQLGAGGEWDGEFEDYRKDGSRVWIEAHVRPVRDGSGATTGILGVSRPITSARAAEIERERQQRYVEALLNAMPAQVAVLGSDGRIREVNRAWEYFGRENTPGGATSPAAGVGSDYVQLCRQCTGTNAAEAAPAAEGIDHVLHGARPYFVMEYPCDSPSTPRWFAMHVTPLTTPEGGAVVAHYDITARKQAELTAATLGRRMELALSAARVGVWRLDLKTNRIEWSAEVYSVVGVAEFDGRRESWLRLVHPDDLPLTQARLQEALERKSSFASEFRIVLPSGEIRWLTNFAYVECDRTGAAEAVVGTVQDVTAAKRSQRAIKAYNRLLELIALGTDLHQILEEVVRLVEDQLVGSLCSILIVDPTTQRLRFGAGGSLPAAYNTAVDGVAVGPRAGSCGTAAYRKATVTVADIATDPLWEDYRESALAHGLKSCISVPILSSGNVPGHAKGTVIGTFALYNRTSGDFDRLTHSVLAGATKLGQEAEQNDGGGVCAQESEALHIIEAAHLAGVAIEREQAGRVLRESEARFRAVLDLSPSAVSIKDLDGRYLFVNRAMANLFDVPIELWSGKKSRELMPTKLAADCDYHDRLARERNGPIGERHIWRIAGRELTILATHFPLYRSDALPYAICSVFRDATDLVEAQRELERLWLHAPDPLCVTGFDGYLKQLNPAWSRLLGWTEAELLARPYAEFVHPDDRAGLADVAARFSEGETVRGYETRCRCRDGSYRWFSWSAIPTVENHTVYGIARDVTEERRLTEQFHQAQKMEAVGQLASGVAHDFNNLLTVINGYSELLLSETLVADSRRDALAQIQAAGQRAAELTSQLLAFGRKAIVEPKLVDVNQILESSARLLRRLIGENVHLETHLTEVPPVKIDPGQLEQVFMNLAVNARDALPHGGRITIRTETIELAAPLRADCGEIAPGRYVQVSVADGGAGMTPEVQARIFEPFFTTKGPGKGTGLGLAMVYGIVRQANGTITVESQLGVGTTFRILLRAEQEPVGRQKSSSSKAAPRGTETVLIVEDEGGVGNFARDVLETHGYTVLAADTGTAALRILREHSGAIDLLLTDVVMPDVGGREVAEHARRRRPGIHILYMSGYTDDSVLRQGVESSRDAFLQKPFSPATLARRVRELLDGTVPPATRPQ